MTEYNGFSEHEKFKELAALAYAGTLTADDWSELKSHLTICGECREAYNEYQTLVTEGIPILAASYTHHSEQGSWDGTATRKKLFARIRLAEQQTSAKLVGQLWTNVETNLRSLLGRGLANPLARAALAASLVVAIGLSAYRLGNRAQTRLNQTSLSNENHFQLMTDEEKAENELFDAQTKRVLELQEEGSQMKQEIAKLRSGLRVAQDRASELADAKGSTEKELWAVSQQRDSLIDRLQADEQALQTVQGELANLRNERDKALLRTASLESRIEELSARNRDEERRLANDEQYLSSDRDIRELMGARQLYIADVFDVDSGSRTQKPFGRIFYTERKSLIFYAFDLDRQPAVRNATTFQAWGRRDADPSKPLNMGIFYIDSESSRRWVLRFDDPERVAQIDAVFVTIEPRGGSQKPTGKPFLYALLRKEANHP